MLRPATPLTILFFIAFVLLIIATISTPIVKSIHLASYKDVNFGVFGYCTPKKCSNIGIGYSVDSNTLYGDANENVDFSLPQNTRSSLSSILVVHPVAALLTLICFILAATAHLHAPSHSPRYLLALLILSIPTLLITLLAFLVDILLFVPHLAWGGWLVLVSTICILASGIVTCAMRRTLVSRKARKKRIAENAEMSGENFYARQPIEPTGPRAETPPPLHDGGFRQGDKLPRFATIETSKSDEDRIPLNQRTPSNKTLPSAPSSRNPGYTEEAFDRYDPSGRGGRGGIRGGSMRGGPQRGYGGPPRDEYGNPLPPSNAFGPSPPAGMRRDRSEPPRLRPQYSDETMGSASSRGRGRGGYPPPRGYGRGGPYGPGRGGYGRGGPQMGMGPGPDMRRGPPPPGYGNGYPPQGRPGQYDAPGGPAGFARNASAPAYGPRRPSPAEGPGGYAPSMEGPFIGAAGYQRGESPGPRQANLGGYQRGPSPGPPSAPGGYQQGPPSGPPAVNRGYERGTSPAMVANGGYGGYGDRGPPPARYPQEYRNDDPGLVEERAQPGRNNMIGQAVEMDAIHGCPSPIPVPGHDMNLRYSDTDVQGFIGLQQQDKHRDSPMSMTSLYSANEPYVPARAGWTAKPSNRGVTPPLNNAPMNQNSDDPIELPVQTTLRKGRSGSNPTATGHNRKASDNYYEDVDPRFANEPVIPQSSQTQAQKPLYDRPVPPTLLPGVSSHGNQPVIRHNGQDIDGQDDYEEIPDGQRSPASDHSNMTSISQRGVNPNWRPGTVVDSQGRLEPSHHDHHRRPVQEQSAVIMNADEDFETPMPGPGGSSRVAHVGPTQMGQAF